MAFKFALKEEEKPYAPPRPVVSIDPFDLVLAKKDFDPYRQKIAVMQQDAQAFDVVDPNTNELAVQMMGQARQLSTAVETLKDKRLKPHNEFRTKMISFAKTFTGPLEDVVKVLKKKTETYAYQEILRQRAEQKAELEAAAKRQAEMDATAAEAGVETVILPQIAVDQEKKVQTRTETGSSLSIKLEWQGTVQNEALVPREYCSPDQKKIDKAIQAGVREIPGVDIRETAKSRLVA